MISSPSSSLQQEAETAAARGKTAAARGNNGSDGTMELVLMQRLAWNYELVKMTDRIAQMNTIGAEGHTRDDGLWWK